MTDQEMKLLHARLKKEDPKLLVLMEKCFDAGVISGKEQAQRTWVGLTDEEVAELSRHELWVKNFIRQIEEKLRIKNT